MTGVIEKDLLNYLLKLEEEQQQLALNYIKELLIKQEMTKRALKSEQDIAEGRVRTLDEFKSEAKEWIKKKSATK